VVSVTRCVAVVEVELPVVVVVDVEDTVVVGATPVAGSDINRARVKQCAVCLN